MRKIIQIGLLLFAAIQIQAQELNCTISINSDKVPGQNKQVYTTLENSLNEFLNQRRWTDYNYKLQERINCNMTITIDQQSGTDFKGSIQIQASRPVYSSNYLTPIFNYKDDRFNYIYEEFEPLIFNENEYQSNLVSMMAYYVYIILGMDGSTFSDGGGKQFFAKAQDVAVQAQQSGYSGWNQNDGSRTRHVLINNLMSPAFDVFHSSMYQYHLLGLDVMSKDVSEAKGNIAGSIINLKSIYDARPGAYLLSIFMDSKSDEIVDIFSDGPRFDTFKLKEDLLRISPLNAEKWNLIE